MRPWRGWIEHPSVAAACIAAVAFGGITGARCAGWLQELELGAYDQYLRLRASDDAGAAEPGIMLVTITEEDLERYDWPLSDDLLARLLERLAARGPRAIGLDLFRDRPVVRRESGPPSEPERSLDGVLRAHEEIVAAMKFPGADGVRVEPPAALADDPGRFGFADILVDPDGIVRRGLLYLDDGAEFRSSLALRLALLYLRPYGIAEAPDPSNPMHLRLGRTTYVPLERDDGGYAGIDARGYQFLLTYPLGAAPPPALTLAEALEGGSEPLKGVRDRIVLIGTTAESVKDLFYSPVRGVGGNRHVYGVTLHAQMASQLIRQALGEARPIRTFGQGWEAAWVGLWCALGSLAALGLRAPIQLAAAAAAGVLILVAVTYPAFAYGWWAPVVPPLLGGLGAMGATVAHVSRQEQRQRAAVMRLFSTYVSPAVADELWAQRATFLEDGRPRPQQLTATVLFSDIRGFTTISEVLSPEELVPWLNEYMEAMAGLVMAHGGIIEKFAGDGITATFGVPVPRTTEAEIARDARNAARCALDMGRELDRLNRTWVARGLPRVGIRVGINTGPLVAGSIGSAKRLQYSIIGDTANTAARLESYDKDAIGPRDASGCRVLISESARRYLGPEYHVEPIGSLQLRGKAKPTAVYRLLRAREGLPGPEGGLDR